MSGEEHSQANTVVEEEKATRISSRKSKSRYQTQEQQQTKETTPSSTSSTAGKQKTKTKNQGGQEEGVGDDNNNSDKSPNYDQAKKAKLARNLRIKYHKYQVQFEYLQLPTNPQLNVMTDPEAYVNELGKILLENDPSKRIFLMLAHARLQGMFHI